MKGIQEKYLECTKVVLIDKECLKSKIVLIGHCTNFTSLNFTHFSFISLPQIKEKEKKTGYVKIKEIKMIFNYYFGRLNRKNFFKNVS